MREHPRYEHAVLLSGAVRAKLAGLLLGGSAAGLAGALLAAGWSTWQQGYWTDGLQRLAVLEAAAQAPLGAALGALGATLALGAGPLRARLERSPLRAVPGAAPFAFGLAVAGLLARPLQRFQPRRDVLLCAALVAAFLVAGALSRPRRATPLRLAVLLLALLAAASAPRLLLDAQAGRPVILVTVDTLRADHLSLSGYDRATSPQLDGLAASAHVFTRAYAHAPLTCSSVASILTGRPPSRHGTFGNDPLHPRERTLAEALRARGYATAAVVSNWVLLARKGFADGFARYDHELPQRERNRGMPERTAAATTAAALDWLDHRPSDAFFLWVHYQDPHGPYTPPAPWDKAFPPRGDTTPLRVGHEPGELQAIPDYQLLGAHRDPAYYVSQYDGELRSLDEGLGAFFRGLARLGLAERALIVLTADHGEGMGEHGYYFAHGDNLLPGVLQVPLLVWHPDVRGGARHHELVQHTDVAPTVLAFAGAAPVQPAYGRPLLPARDDGRAVFSEAIRPRGRYLAALTARDLQVVYDANHGRVEAYDPGTGALLPADDAARARGLEPLRRQLLSAVAQVDAEWSRLPRWGRPTDAELERLRALGYVH